MAPLIVAVLLWPQDAFAWYAEVSEAQPLIPSFSVRGYKHSKPANVDLRGIAVDNLRITDARVTAVTDTHAVLISKETGDVLLLPLAAAAANFQVRGRAANALKEALAVKKAQGGQDDAFSSNAWLIEKGAKRLTSIVGPSKSNASKHPSAQGSGTQAGTPSSTPTIANTSVNAASNAHDIDAEAMRQHQEAITQMERFSRDSQKNASRMQQDAIRQHNRIVEDMNHGQDSTGASTMNRFAEDSQINAARQANDAHLQGIRQMNDSISSSGGARPFPEQVMPDPVIIQPSMP